MFTRTPPFLDKFRLLMLATVIPHLIIPGTTGQKFDCTMAKIIVWRSSCFLRNSSVMLTFCVKRDEILCKNCGYVLIQIKSNISQQPQGISCSPFELKLVKC